MKRGIVFGCFDRLHPGHQWFLRQALKQCDHLTIIVAQDEEIECRKKRSPAQTMEDRIGAIRQFLPNATVMAGDAHEEEWSAFGRDPFDLCILGYDQNELRKALENYKQQQLLQFNIVQLLSYYPERFKSSLSFNSQQRV